MAKAAAETLFVEGCRGLEHGGRPLRGQSLNCSIPCHYRGISD